LQFILTKNKLAGYRGKLLGKNILLGAYIARITEEI